MCNDFAPRRPRSKPKMFPATCEERPLPGQEGSLRRSTCGRETQNRHPPDLGDKTAGRADSSACGIHRLDAGDNALKVERRAAPEGGRREARRLSTNLEEGILEAKRRGRPSNPGPRLPGFQGTTLSSRKTREFRPYNVMRLSVRRQPSAAGSGLAASYSHTCA